MWCIAVLFHRWNNALPWVIAWTSTSRISRSLLCRFALPVHLPWSLARYLSTKEVRWLSSRSVLILRFHSGNTIVFDSLLYDASVRRERLYRLGLADLASRCKLHNSNNTDEVITPAITSFYCHYSSLSVYRSYRKMRPRYHRGASSPWLAVWD